MLVFLLCASLRPALAQSPKVSFGALGGARLSDFGRGVYDESRRYTVGPSIEVLFGDHFAFEFDALYKRLGSSLIPLAGFDRFLPAVRLVTGQISYEYPYPYYAARYRAHSWEFPVTGKYYLGDRSQPSRFFLQTGYSFQRSWITSNSTWVQRTVATEEILLLNDRLTWSPPVTVGAVFGGGITRRTGPITWAPSFRYTRWGSSASGLARNQSELLLGMSF